MSYYEYYEFRAIDRPLTKKEQEDVASLSRRAVVSSRHAVFTYNYTELPAKPETVLLRCFDAMIFLTSAGRRELYFRFPVALSKVEEWKEYCFPDVLELVETEDFVVVKMICTEESGFYWEEDSEILLSFLSLRQDILEGDYRILYLAWLQGIAFAMDWEDDEIDFEPEYEPPVPPNLRQLSEAHQTFMEFWTFPLDLYNAAAKESPTEVIQKPTKAQCLKEIKKLSMKEKEEFLFRVLEGEPNLGIQLQQKLFDQTKTKVSSKEKKKNFKQRTIRELIHLAKKEEVLREKREKAEENRKKRIRIELLKKQGEEGLWNKIDELLLERSYLANQQVVNLLLDLKDLAKATKTEKSFRKKLSEFVSASKTRTALLRDMKEAGLKFLD